jgi:hypothetical protein
MFSQALRVHAQQVVGKISQINWLVVENQNVEELFAVVTFNPVYRGLKDFGQVNITYPNR